MNILVLKSVKTHPELPENYCGNWKLSPIRLRNVDFGIVLSDGVVVAQFQLGDVVSYNLVTGRLVFSPEPYYGKYNLLNKKYDYRTSNPATIKTLEELEKIEMAQKVID